MQELSHSKYKDWKDFFRKRLTVNNDFALARAVTEIDRDVEIYSSLKHNIDTYIEVSYFSLMTLFSVKVLNPATPGKNKEQDNEYFYRYDFTPGKEYGGVGLDFNEMNVEGIEGLLSEGLSGEERVYYKNGKPLKSVLITDITYSYYFDNSGFWERLLRKWAGGKEKYDEVKTIKLEDIFKGLQ
jgi:hypothetical protein